LNIVIRKNIVEMENSMKGDYILILQKD